METVTDFIFLGSRITVDGDWSHEIKILAPWKKSYDKSRQRIKKQMGNTCTSLADACWCMAKPIQYCKVKKNNKLKKKKSRDITLVSKVHIVKAMVFPVVVCRCESWTIKKAEHWRIDDFKLWCWRTLESPLGSKEIKPVNPKGNQSWIFIGRTVA